MVRMKLTPEDVAEIRSQLDRAEKRLIDRWKHLSGKIEDLGRISSGGATVDDSELLMECVETCFAQCMIYVSELQLQEAGVLENAKDT